LNLLLDTHIWLWMLHDSRRLGRRLLTELKNETNELWLSPISTWEALTLTRATTGIPEAPLTHEIALVARQISLHQDPADRILAATAQVLDLTLATADEKLLGLGGIRSLANR
jgi:PIN domain nuclease of toxin-antitoxin system